MIQELDATKSSYTYRSQTQVPKSSWLSTPKTGINSKSVENDTKNKSTQRDLFKISLTIKCYKCQCYVVNCPSPIKVAIDKKLSVTNSEFNSEEVISQAKEPADYDSGQEIKSDDIKKSITRLLSRTPQ